LYSGDNDFDTGSRRSGLAVLRPGNCRVLEALQTAGKTPDIYRVVPLSAETEARNMKVALVHDWLTNLAGAERVILALHETFPDAPIFTSVYVPELFPELAGADVRTSFLQKIPGATRKHQAFPILRTVAFENFDLSEYDVVISSCHAEAKGVITQPDTLHICYCYTPIRYYWGGYFDYLNNPRFGPFNPVVRAVMPFMASYLRLWDRCAADRVDVFVATCRNVARRIRKYYRREPLVLYPPVTTEWLKPSESVDDFFLVAGRQIPYKRTDIAVKAFNKLGLPLKIAGNGTELEYLKSIARPNIEFLGRIPDDELAELYSRCIAFVFPQEEDFGITPLEAMAAGRPVIAFRGGGALETVVEGKTGVFFDIQDEQCLVETVKGFEPEAFDPAALRAHASKFDVSAFKKNFEELVATEWSKFSEAV
jgi:glycosyltransferase involved in cell wall biosynthesis